jgi:hypothetical protein
LSFERENQVSEDKLEVHIEIGPNLRSVLEESFSKMDLYNDPVAAEGVISTLFGSIKNMIVDILTVKKPENKEIEIECPTLNKKEDQH